MNFATRFLLAIAFALACVMGAFCLLTRGEFPWWTIIAVPAFFCAMVAGGTTIACGFNVWWEE